MRRSIQWTDSRIENIPTQDRPEIHRDELLASWRDADDRNVCFVVYSGSEHFDLGPKTATALCSSETQAEALISALWPGTGYWEKISK